MPLHIHGIGTAVPPNAISQEEAAATAALYGCTSPEHQRQIKALYRLSRVRKRHSVVLESDSRDGKARQSFFPPMKGADDRDRPRPIAWGGTNATRRLLAPGRRGSLSRMRGARRATSRTL